ncbi:MAG: PA2779 family protein [Gammaproteobacteria bacterium]|nr:PA2779 family protein [Gammaproteobacteria bacterium]
MKQKLFAWIALLGFFGSVTLPAQAAMISTPDVIQSQQSQYEREQLSTMLDRSDIQDKLVSMGVAPESVQERINSMTDFEVAQLNQQINDMPAGSGIVGIIVLLFVVFVITDAVGATDIFPFVRPVR